MADFSSIDLQDITQDFDEIPVFSMEEEVQMHGDMLSIIDNYIVNNIKSIKMPNFSEQLEKEVFNIMFITIKDAYDYDIETELKVIVQYALSSYYKSIMPKRECKGTFIRTKPNITQLDVKIEKIRNKPQPDQRTQEWYEFRHGLITASAAWQALDTQSNINHLICDKCKPIMVHSNTNVNTDSPFHWGVKYEPITIMIYEDINNTKIGEFGCIPHPKYSFIGASPDGINIEPYNNDKYGRMIEIKNIVNREITGIPKEEYWIQTQVQMETCDLDECDFIETRIKEYNNEEQFLEDNTHNYKGIVLHFIEKPPVEMNENTTLSSTPIYKYMPLNIPINNTNIQNWINYEKEDMKQKNLVLFEVNYWYLHEYSCVLIQRNRLWFSYAINKIENLWNTIIHERIKGYAHRATKKRKRTLSLASDDATVSCSPPRIIGCLINIDDDGNVINN